MTRTLARAQGHWSPSSTSSNKFEGHAKTDDSIEARSIHKTVSTFQSRQMAVHMANAQSSRGHNNDHKEHVESKIDNTKRIAQQDQTQKEIQTLLRSLTELVMANNRNSNGYRNLETLCSWGLGT